MASMKPYRRPDIVLRRMPCKSFVPCWLQTLREERKRYRLEARQQQKAAKAL